MARILVVDDEELARYTIREILRSVWHEVVEAANGEEAISLQNAKPFDLVITDIIMPVKGGVETIIELKKNYPKLKVIGISGGGRSRNMNPLIKAGEIGADRILVKPFSQNELLDYVNACLPEDG